MRSKTWFAGALVGMAAIAGWIGEGPLTQQWVAAQGANATGTGSAPAARVALATPALPADAHVRFGAWQSLGPSNLACPAQSVQVDPQTGDLYALAESGWVFRSSDRAQTWTAHAKFMAPFRYERLFVHRSSASLAFYAISDNAAYRRHLLRLEPDGTTKPLPIVLVQDVAFGPAGMYVAWEDGVSLSTDGGLSYTTLVGGEPEYHTIACWHVRASGTTVIASCTSDADPEHLAHQAWRSVGGAPFERTWEALVPPVGNVMNTQLATSPSNPNVAYIAIENYGSGPTILRTGDAGATWQVRSDGTSTNPFNAAVFADFEGRCIQQLYPGVRAAGVVVDPGAARDRRHRAHRARRVRRAGGRSPTSAASRA